MITHSFTMNFLYFLLLVKNKSRPKFRSREKVDFNFLFILSTWAQCERVVTTFFGENHFFA